MGINIIFKVLVFKVDVILVFKDIVDIVFYNFISLVVFVINVKDFVFVRVVIYDIFLKL